MSNLLTHNDKVVARYFEPGEDEYTTEYPFGHINIPSHWFNLTGIKRLVWLRNVKYHDYHSGITIQLTESYTLHTFCKDLKMSISKYTNLSQIPDHMMP